MYDFLLKRISNDHCNLGYSFFFYFGRFKMKQIVKRLKAFNHQGEHRLLSRRCIVLNFFYSRNHYEQSRVFVLATPVINRLWRQSILASIDVNSEILARGYPASTDAWRIFQPHTHGK